MIGETEQLQVDEHIVLEKFEGDVKVETVVIDNGVVTEVIDHRPK
jgi:hypothetical protein